jgi:dGTPase
MRQDAPFEAVSFEAQIMDFADDIAYSVHDLEDAIVAGSVKLDDLKNDLPTLHKDMSDSYLRGISLDEAAAALERLANLNYWPKSFGGTHRDLAGLKDLTSQLIGRFAIAAEDLTKEHYSGALTRFNANLMIPTEIKNEVAFLKSLTGFYIINHHRQQKNYQAQKLVLKEIANWISQNPQERISPFYLESFNSAANENAAKRVIIDQVASMTDFGAMDLFEKQIAKPGLG